MFYCYVFINCGLIEINWNAQWKKHDFWKLLKTELSVFANELFIYSLCAWKNWLQYVRKKQHLLM